MEKTYELHIIKTSQGQWSNYCYLVVDKLTRSACLFDPSWELNKISKKLQELQINLKMILLTHSHYDHVNLVNPLLEMFDPIVYMSIREIEYYQFRCKNLVGVDDNEKIRLGYTEILSLLTPGHTAGSMCYLLSDSLFTGDTIFIEGCGICTEPGGSPEYMFYSIQRIHSQIAPQVKIYPGHSYGKDPGQTMEHLTKENIYFQIQKKEQFIKFRMRENQKDYLDFK